MSEMNRARSLLIGLVVACYASVFVLVPVVHLSVDVGGFARLTAYSFGSLIIFGALCHWRKIPSLQATIESVSLGLAMTGPLVILAYVAATIDLPLQDQRLIAMDLALGINWASLIQEIDSSAILVRVLMLAYQAFQIQLLLIPALLSISGQPARAYQMMTAYGLICILASIISIWYPAVGTYAAFSVDLANLKNLSGTLGTEFVPQLLAVRSDPNFTLHLSQASGIISFPSVHAAVAVLCGWAMWTKSWMRWPFVVLNALVWCSAVTEGGHYIVDLISGTGLSGFAIASVLCATRSYPMLRTRMRNDGQASDLQDVKS